jgi:eukaryotic-like serine/threonine-protein kinase
MDQHRWQRIERLYHSALERDPEQRSSFLAQECRNDEDLRREVESLLKENSPAERLLDRPAVERAGSFLDETSDSGFAAGTQLGPYQLLGPLGMGGMGRVYQARDGRLGRNVAIKVSHERFSQRFTREARAIAQLSHSNICTLYDIGPNYLVMECVEGGTLEAKISSGPLPIPEAIDIAYQIAQGLRFAHAKQILHRDIKPANVMLTAEGQVKIMDFGLAKRSGGGEASDDRTRTDDLTAAGTLLGTPAYMSPEQARGEPADQQSDVWALGVVMYEMVAGRRPFAAENSLALLRSILDDEPPRLAAVRPDCPAELQRIVDRALAKKRAARYASAAELLADLSPLNQGNVNQGNVNQGSAVTVPRRNRRLLLYAGACLAAAGIVALIVAGRSGGKPPTIKMEQITAFQDSATNPSLSADGRMLAFIRGPLTFTTTGQVYVKQLPGGDAVQLTNDATVKMHPVFSPDGSRVAYTVRTPDESWDTWEVPVLGGQPRPWLPNASGLSWIAPDRILFSEIKEGMHMALATAATSRSDARDIYVPANVRGMVHRSHLSPDRKWVLLTEMIEGFLPCRLVPFDGKSTGRPVGPPNARCTYTAWSPDGHWMYFSSGAGGTFQIWRQKFPDGVPEQLTSGPTESEGLAVSPDGRSLITSLGLRQSSVWLNQDGTERQVSAEGNAVFPAWGDGFPRSVFSRDGRLLYYLHSTGGRGFHAGELWAYDISARSNERVLASVSMNSFDLSPNGRDVVYSAIDVAGVSKLWMAPLNRRAGPHMLAPREGFGPVFGGDDEILYRARENGQGYIFQLQLGSGVIRKAIAEPAINSPIVSPDGKWIVSRTPANERDRTGVVKAYPRDGGAPLVLCAGCFPRWTSDGRWLHGSPGPGFLLPLAPGKMFPAGSGGLTVESMRRIPGARAISSPNVFPGVSGSVYAFEKESIQRNLYRIVLE